MFREHEMKLGNLLASTPIPLTEGADPRGASEVQGMDERHTDEVPPGWGDLWAEPAFIVEDGPPVASHRPVTFWDDVVAVVREAVGRPDGARPTRKPPHIPPRFLTPSLRTLARDATTGPRREDGRRTRGAVIADLLDLHEMVGEEALRARARTTLRRVGVASFDPAGWRFDPVRHVQVGVRPTPSRPLEWIVAETIALGFTDEQWHRLVRPARVVVFRLEGEDRDGR